MHKLPIVAEDITRILAADIPWEQLHGKTILVTGAAGALAGYMVQTLLHLNDTLAPTKQCRIIALVRNEQRGKDYFSAYLGRRDFSLLIQDVCEPITLQEEVHFIIHAASQASPKYYGIDPVGTLNANVLGTHQLLSFAKQQPVESFLFFSTSEVYGQAGNPASIVETDFGAFDPTNIRACYGESKRLGEAMCVAWNKQHAINTKIVRPFHIYGPGFQLNDGRVFADFVACVLAGKDIVITSDGSAVRSFCYLADAVHAFFLVLLKGEAATAYNVGNPAAALSVLELAQLLIRTAPEKGLKFVSAPQPTGHYIPSSVSRIVPNIERIGTLGWQPLTSPEIGFTRMINSYL